MTYVRRVSLCVALAGESAQSCVLKNTLEITSLVEHKSGYLCQQRCVDVYYNPAASECEPSKQCA